MDDTGTTVLKTDTHILLLGMRYDNESYLNETLNSLFMNKSNVIMNLVQQQPLNCTHEGNEYLILPTVSHSSPTEVITTISIPSMRLHTYPHTHAHMHTHTDTHTHT